MQEPVAIELTPEHGESIRELIPAKSTIQQRKPLIVHAFFSASEMQAIIEHLPPQGLCVIARAETIDEARRLQDAVLP